MLCLPTFHRLLKRKLCGRDACGLALKCISSHVCSNVPVRIRIFSMYFLSSFSTIAKEYTFLEREPSYSEVHKVLARPLNTIRLDTPQRKVSSVCVLFGWESELPSSPDVAVTTQTMAGSDTTSFPSHLW